MNTDIPYCNSLYDYFDLLNNRANEARCKKIFGVSSFEEAQKHCAEVKKKLTSLMGKDKFPCGTTPPQVVATIKKNGVLIDKVLLEVRPGIFTAGLFLRKEGVSSPMPGILGVCGHSNNGKACDSYQSFAFGLALKGFGVLICDPSGQGECHQFDPPPAPTMEHSILGKALRSAGVLTASLFIHDAQRALDYLVSRPEIDGEKIGVTGSSGGGQMSFFLFALDERIKCAGASCHMNKLYDVFRNETATDAESTPEGLIAAGCDRPDFAIAGAPKPFLLMATEQDFLDLRSVKSAYAETAHIYKHLGAEKDLHFNIAPGPHAYCKESREAMYGFFTTRFMGKEDRAEPAFELLTEEEVQVTPTGFTMDLPGALNENEALLKTLPSSYNASSGEIISFLREALALPSELPPAPDYRVPRSRPLTDHSVAGRFVLITEPGTTIRPVLQTEIQHDTPLLPQVESATLHCAHLSAQEELRSRSGEKDLFVFDVRGVGESRSTAARGTPDDFFAPVGRDSFVEGTAELHGCPLAGGKVRDLLAAVALMKENGCKNLTLSGRGMGGIIAAFAAAAVKLPINKLILTEVPLSLKGLLEKRIFRVPNSCLPKGMLQHFDFQELYALLKKNYDAEISCSEDVPADIS